MTITKAERVPATAVLPSYCRADGTLDPRTGAEGKHYALGFALALPENWNGRFLFHDGGALNGTLQEPLGKQAAGQTPALARGFAVAVTDSGHQGSPFDPSFFRDQQASLDFSYAAIGKIRPAFPHLHQR